MASTKHLSTSKARSSFGWLPPRALGFVDEWALLHAGELQANWDRARNDQPLLAIESLA